jgi:hypothetical protein
MFLFVFVELVLAVRGGERTCQEFIGMRGSAISFHSPPPPLKSASTTDSDDAALNDRMRSPGIDLKIL